MILLSRFLMFMLLWLFSVLLWLKLYWLMMCGFGVMLVGCEDRFWVELLVVKGVLGEICMFGGMFWV